MWTPGERRRVRRSPVRRSAVVVFLLRVVAVASVGSSAELDASDDVVAIAAAAVVGLPFAVDQAAGNRDRAPLREIPLSTSGETLTIEDR